MTLTLLIVFITVAGAGFAFWFFNRKQINSLTETIEDKNAVIHSFREHLTTPIEESTPNVPIRFNPEHESVIDLRPEKKKQRYNNRPKKNTSEQKTNQQKENTEKKNRPKPRRKPKTQQ